MISASVFASLRQIFVKWLECIRTYFSHDDIEAALGLDELSPEGRPIPRATDDVVSSRRSSVQTVIELPSTWRPKEDTTSSASSYQEPQQARSSQISNTRAVYGLRLGGIDRALMDQYVDDPELRSGGNETIECAAQSSTTSNRSSLYSSPTSSGPSTPSPPVSPYPVSIAEANDVSDLVRADSRYIRAADLTIEVEKAFKLPIGRLENSLKCQGEPVFVSHQSKQSVSFLSLPETDNEDSWSCDTVTPSPHNSCTTLSKHQSSKDLRRIHTSFPETNYVLPSPASSHRSLMFKGGEGNSGVALGLQDSYYILDPFSSASNSSPYFCADISPSTTPSENLEDITVYIQSQKRPRKPSSKMSKRVTFQFAMTASKSETLGVVVTPPTPVIPSSPSSGAMSTNSVASGLLRQFWNRAKGTLDKVDGENDSSAQIRLAETRRSGSCPGGLANLNSSTDNGGYRAGQDGQPQHEMTRQSCPALFDAISQHEPRAASSSSGSFCGSKPAKLELRLSLDGLGAVFSMINDYETESDRNLELGCSY